MRVIYGVFNNSDLTEGRGYIKPIAYFTTRESAKAHALKRDVQGTNAAVRPVPLYEDATEARGEPDLDAAFKKIAAKLTKGERVLMGLGDE